MLRVLDDQEWHRVESVVQAMARKVPPGRAVRIIESQRQRLTPGKPRKVFRALEDQEFSGQVWQARDTLRAWIRGGRLELRGDLKEDREVRLTPRDDENHLSSIELAHVLSRASTTINAWVRTPSIVAQVSTLLPLANRHVAVVVTNRSGHARFPQESVVAWRRFSETRNWYSKGSSGLLVGAVASVFGLDIAIAEIRVAEIQKYMAANAFEVPSSHDSEEAVSPDVPTDASPAC
jgi:hypothetical protein